jgi:soluble lytic murein transglycosylase-like protein
MVTSRLLTIPVAVLASALLGVFLFWFSGQAAPENSTLEQIVQPSTEVPGVIRAAAKLGAAIFRIAIDNQLKSATEVKSQHSNEQSTNTPASDEYFSMEQSTDSCAINQGFPEKIMRWCDLITRNSLKQGLDPDLLAALILQESGGNPSAYSHSGAVGLMQVMPRDGLAAAFMCPNGPCFKNRPTINELENPEFNVAYGTKMLAGLINQRGSLREALKYYGPADVGYYYADIVLGLYEQYGN